uniref:Tr-type G domain-containing protein n=1 Tax=Strigamia maritima TaxID=126957 RepID=T1J683_STRMM
MSRHRNIRKMNYDEECDIDEVYGRSVEDDYCISPNTAAEFMYDRTAKNYSFSNYLTGENDDIPEEEAELPRIEDKRPLSDLDKARLQSCLEEIYNVVGDSIPVNIVKEAIIDNEFDVEKSLDKILSDNSKDEPKPQRIRRERTRKDQSLNLSLSSLIRRQENSDNRSTTGVTREKCASSAGVGPTLTDLAKQNLARPAFSLSNLIANCKSANSNDLTYSSSGSTSLMDLARQNRSSRMNLAENRSDKPTFRFETTKMSDEFENPSENRSDKAIFQFKTTKMPLNRTDKPIFKFTTDEIDFSKENRWEKSSLQVEDDMLDLSHALKVQRLSESEEDSGIGTQDATDSSPCYSIDETYPKHFILPSNPALEAPPSLFARIICLKLRPPPEPNPVSTVSHLTGRVVPFDFSCPSPNDLVNERNIESASTVVEMEKVFVQPEVVKAVKENRKIDVDAEYAKERASSKDVINMVVIGHVDAGKSTLMGHLLFLVGAVSQKLMHKYRQESKKIGKTSNRGITMDVGQFKFETERKIITLLDAPGHKDFIPNMITGAAQADAAILVVDATKGEFETGFESGGQTREHALLVRSLGVSQLVVVVNKLDTVEWSENRFAEIVKKIGHFLKQVGYKESDIEYIPCSGLTGSNLKDPPTEDAAKWYHGRTLLQQIDNFKSPERPMSKPFRMSVGDIFKGQLSGFCVSGRIETGYISSGDRVLVMPQGETAHVKGICIDDAAVNGAFAGDQVTLSIANMDMANVTTGSIMCSLAQPIRASSVIQARIVIFNIDVPITKGFPVVFHYQTLSEPAVVRKLLSQLHRNTGEVVKNKPRCLVKNSSAMIEIEVGRPVCVELYKDFKELGRFMLRSKGSTIAAGLVTMIL